MTKAELVNELSIATGYDKKTITLILEGAMDCIKNHLADDEGIYLRGFGTFILKKRAAKTARDINKKSTVFVPAHRVVNFQPSKELADKVR